MRGGAGFASDGASIAIDAVRRLILRATAPRRIELTCDPPADTALRQRVFGCPVRFGAAEARIHFAPELLDHVSADAEDEQLAQSRGQAWLGARER